MINDPSIMRNSAHADFKVEKFDKVRIVKVNSLLFVRGHHTPNIYVDHSVHVTTSKKKKKR